jgi:DNA-directed RNA polymerase specialized sigma24 family protein
LDESPSPKEKWALTREAFDRLLAWLDPDREQAGRKYEEIRSALIKGFTKHGCNAPEELADETINRVARKLPEIEPTYVGDPAPYFFAVAFNVYREFLRRPETVPLPQIDLPAPDPSPGEPADDIDPVLVCLSRCIRHLKERDREVILQYYQGEKQVKIRLRKELALRLGLSLPALRLLAQRIRQKLKKLILLCLKQNLPDDAVSDLDLGLLRR